MKKTNAQRDLAPPQFYTRQRSAVMMSLNKRDV